MFQKAFNALNARMQTSEHSFMMLAAALIGMLGGLGAIVFRSLIRLIQVVGFGRDPFTLKLLEGLPAWQIVAVPAAGGLLVGPIVYYFARETRGHGVPEVMEAVALKQGVIRKRTAFAKIVASAISIGTGASVGREGPIVQIGSAIGSALGQFLKVSRSKLKTMVGCGAAAGIAATFNAPVAGVLFSMEIIVGDFGVRRFTPIVVSSVVATAFSRHFLGNTPAFEIAVDYEMVSPLELFPYSVLGVAAGLAGLVFIWMIYKSEDLFERLTLPSLMKPVMGGALVGTIALKFPNVFGVGYESIERALNEEMVWTLLLLLVGVKIVATSLTLGSGGSGGIFAPSLFVGAVLGGAMGYGFHGMFPQITATPGAYALVGMGAVVSATTHAPLTAIMIIFEMTGDYQIILPLMFACIISTAISSRLNKDSIYTLKLTRRGTNILRGRDVNVLSSLSVQGVLTTDHITIQEQTQLGAMLQLLVSKPHSHFYVTDERGLFKGVVTVDDFRQVILESGALEHLIIAGDVMKTDVHRIHPEDRLDQVMRLFGATRSDELPVVNSGKGDRLIGVVTQQAVINAYNSEIMKRDAVSEVVGGIDMATSKGSINLSDGITIAELEAPGWMVGKSLAQLDLRKTKGIQILMINPSREAHGPADKQQFVPRPDYKIKLGDNLLMIGRGEVIRAL